MIEIELPLPEKILQPNSNSGKHWVVKKDAKSHARDYAYYKAYPYRGKFRLDQRLSLAVHFYYPDNRGRDIDNGIASIKHHIDGVFLGLKLNDEQIDEMHNYKTYGSCHPRVTFKLEESFRSWSIP